MHHVGNFEWAGCVRSDRAHAHNIALSIEVRVGTPVVGVLNSLEVPGIGPTVRITCLGHAHTSCKGRVVEARQAAPAIRRWRWCQAMACPLRIARRRERHVMEFCASEEMPSAILKFCAATPGWHAAVEWQPMRCSLRWQQI